MARQLGFSARGSDRPKSSLLRFMNQESTLSPSLVNKQGASGQGLADTTGTGGEGASCFASILAVGHGHEAADVGVSPK